MPLYDFQCNDCQKTFEIQLSLAQHEKAGVVVCPSCGSRNVKQLIAGVTVITGKKS